MSKTIWRLKQGADKRVKGLHPWVYSNELAESPKGIQPGALVELQDAEGQFVARGYGNPSSLIAFRVVTRDSRDHDPLSVDSLAKKLGAAARFRAAAGFEGVSHRLCYGESDSLPGLVIDRYLFADKPGQAFVIQAHTAGANLVINRAVEALESLNASLPENIPWAATTVVFRNDLNVRKLEGLEPEDPRIFKTDREPSKARIKIKSASGGEPLIFETDLVFGQKTGFFLDQFANIELSLARLPRARGLKVLDLCCYVGQWSAQFARAFEGAEFTLVDASAKALELARANVSHAGGVAKALKMDVLEGLTQLDPQSYDVIICDPPALIKGRKDINNGKHGYLKLNTNAMRLLKPGGWYVSCSCSALFEENDLVFTLTKAARRNNMRFQWVARGTPSPDHPLLTEFTEGHYLKCWVGRSNPGL
ncbi:MAG TPA: methyltransferase [Bdellovibrionales bacterium]|nr:methyltransferase [Bdellovibrionales bacterium]